MRAETTRRAVIMLLGTALSLLFFATSCSPSQVPYSVALIGFSGGEVEEERNAIAEYGQRRVEAELGVEVDFIMPGSGEKTGDLFSIEDDEGYDLGYDLVITLGQDSSLDMLFARPEDTTVQAAALDFELSQQVPGEDEVLLVRYRVEEGAYVCGYLAAWLTSRNDHPLNNTLPLVAFIGALDDPLEAYYDGGFNRGVQAAGAGSHSYYIESGEDMEAARAYAEEACEKGVDIFFCTPGPFNSEVLEVAEEEEALVILVGADRSSESPSHVLTSLILRDDNAIFEVVERALNGDLDAGREAWGIEEGVWSLAPFHVHDPYIKRELKEALLQEEEGVSGIDFSP